MTPAAPPASGPQEAPTPGQAAYEATMPLLNGDLDGETYPWAKLPQRLRDAWDAAGEAANRAGLARVLAERARYKAERDDYAARLKATDQSWAAVTAERDAAREELAAAEAERDDWHEAADGWEGNFHAARKDADRYRAALDNLRPVLRDHYLMHVTCDPERKQDNPVCQCSRVHLGWHPSIGAAVEAWIDHVLAIASAALAGDAP